MVGVWEPQMARECSIREPIWGDSGLTETVPL